MASEVQSGASPTTPKYPVSSSAESPQRPETPRRESSIRFSEETNISSRSPMSRIARTPSDEITPIRNADNTPGRNYNTSEAAEVASASTQATKRKNKSDPSIVAHDAEDEHLPWYKRVAENYGSVSLENKGSVARDHLALERTFLAWLRTSLAFASIGIAVTQLFRLNTTISSRQHDASPSVPLAPMVGQSIPVELVPFLQQLVAANTPAVQQLGPTLLDQLLLLPPLGETTAQPSLTGTVKAAAFDERAAERLRHVGKPLGATFLGISIVILLIGFHRYFESQHWIIRGKFPASRGSIFIVAFMAAALIIASLVVVLVIAPTSYEKK